MAKYRHQLPQLEVPLFLTEGGTALTRYFESYAPIAVRDRVGIVPDTATWRASDWAARLGYGVHLSPTTPSTTT